MATADVWSDFFDASTHYTGPPLTDAMVVSAERTLGYALPASYLQLLRPNLFMAFVVSRRGGSGETNRQNGRKHGTPPGLLHRATGPHYRRHAWIPLAARRTLAHASCLLSLRHGTPRNCPEATNADRVQLLDLRPARCAVGVLYAEGRPCPLPEGRDSGLLLWQEDVPILSLQSLRVCHAL